MNVPSTPSRQTTQKRIEARSNQHDQIDFDSAEDNLMKKTAGTYIGEYPSETYAHLQNRKSLDTLEFENGRGVRAPDSASHQPLSPHGL